MQSFAFLSFALAVAAAPAPAQDGVKVPVGGRKTLAPRADGTVNGAAVLESINSTLHKYRASFTLPTYDGASIEGIIAKRATANEPLTDQYQDGEDLLYYGPFTVGADTPQQFTADFDTGSADLFVPGPQCGADQGCVGSTKYDRGGINEMNMTSVTYGSGMVTGNNYFDSVTVAGLKADHTNVISLTNAQGFANSQSNSLMGMAFSTIANSMQPTYFENLMSQGVVSQPRFAFYLGRGKSNTQGKSEMTLGGVDKSRYNGALTRVPVSSKGYWQVAVDNAKVNGISSGPTTKGQAAIDTGTTLILAPTAAAAAIFAQIPGAFPIPLASGSPTITVYALPCNTQKRVSLGFAGKQFQINPLDLNLGRLTDSFASMIGDNALSKTLDGLTGGGLCLAGIASGDIQPAQNLYVVGDVFLKNWYSVYDYSNGASVSFAKATGNQ